MLNISWLTLLFSETFMGFIAYKQKDCSDGHTFSDDFSLFSKLMHNYSECQFFA